MLNKRLKLMPIRITYLRLFFFFNYLLGLWLVADSIPFPQIAQQGFIVYTYLCLTFLLYGLYYWLPAMGLSFVVARLVQSPKLGDATAILLSTVTALLLYANAKLFTLYGMHINGFVLNLVFTPGGLDSLGGSQNSNLGFAVIASLFILSEILLIWVAKRTVGLMQSINNQRPNSYPWTAFGLFAFVSISVHMVFAYDWVTKNRFTLVAQSIPFYQSLTARHFFERLGLKVHREVNYQVKGMLNYPRNPLRIHAPKKPYNIIWLTSESLRADMLNEQIMPNTIAFSKKASRFTQNYSGGNGTRMGVFSMLMGLPGSYWFQALQEQRGAALVDVLISQNYQIQLYTSALFSYPEFDRTVFAKVPSDLMHERQYSGKLSWQNDHDNVTDMLNFLDHRDTSNPFFSFMFFESPHARYFFPETSVISRPYKDDLNYATLSRETLRKDIQPIKNRYINAVHHLDSQFGRIFDYLSKHQLLQNTIVVVIGDHGEEFMEHGFWGHNATFVDQQTRTPLVIYVPGNPPLISDQLTSHMDVVATLMPLLGVTNPTSDYSLGIRLFNNEQRNYTYLADWEKIVYVDQEVKIVQPNGGKGLFTMQVSTKDDQPLEGESAKRMVHKKQPNMQQLMQDLSHFIKKPNA